MQIQLQPLRCCGHIKSNDIAAIKNLIVYIHFNFQTIISYIKTRAFVTKRTLQYFTGIDIRFTTIIQLSLRNMAE